MPQPLSTITYTTLFPNVRQPRHGIFIEQRLRHLMSDFPLTTRVVAPVPWFPIDSKAFGQYGVYAGVPAREQIEGLHVWHPGYPVIPRLSWYVSPWLLYLATRRTVTELHAQKPAALIDAHYFYPDGVAAVMLGRQLGIPVCISARGSDITVMPDYALPRRWIMWAAEQAAALITVCSALRDRLVEFGVASSKITVLRNGVDLERFKPVDGTALRNQLGIKGRLLLSVGNLVELKGNHLTIDALKDLPDCSLAIIGEGPEREALRRHAVTTGVDERVRFIGLVPQEELRNYYSAADVLVLASSREGWANVLLEAMACGTPVVATRVWGTPEVVASDAAGVLVNERSAAGIVNGIKRLFASPPPDGATRAYAESFSWEATSRGQYELFSGLATGRIAEG